MQLGRFVTSLLAAVLGGCRSDAPLAASWPGDQVRIGGTDVSIERRHVADLVVTTGRVLITDALTRFDALEVSVPPGRYPVVLSRVNVPDDEERNAFVTLVVSGEPAVRWEWALNASDVDRSRSYDPPGFSVDSWHAGFMDAEARQAMGQQPDDDNTLAEEHEANAGTWNVHTFPGTTANVVTFFSGSGSGVYSAKVGYDAAGRVCRVVVDFQLASYEVAAN